MNSGAVTMRSLEIKKKCDHVCWVNVLKLVATEDFYIDDNQQDKLIYLYIFKVK